MPDKPSEAGKSDAKDKFREALERKRSHQSARAAEVQGESKIHGEHGAVGGKRTFRRKSGG
ncbi:MAG: DUF5302 domain-containing protein [Jatrophihabitantaceae bacterium]